MLILVFTSDYCSSYLQMIDMKFGALFNHSMLLLRKRWLFGIIDDFITKQLPHNVTWGLSLLYAMEHKGDRALTSTQGGISFSHTLLLYLLKFCSECFLSLW